MKKFNNKNVLVSGGAAGIGKGIVQAFALEGATVYFADINSEMGINTKKDITSFTGNKKIEFIRTDFSCQQDIDNLIEQVLGKAGFIDVLVNNVGVNLRSGNILEHSNEELSNTFKINLYSYIYCIQGFLPAMIKRKQGSIVNVSSTMGLGAKGFTAYSVSKGSIITLTKALALDHATDNIRVNAVAPGLIATPSTGAWINQQENAAEMKGIPLNRVGRPDDIANAVIFLASEQASYITGHVLIVDGGLSVGE